MTKTVLSCTPIPAPHLLSPLEGKVLRESAEEVPAREVEWAYEVAELLEWGGA